MPLKIVRNDITKMTVDAIVNAANSSLMGGGGVDGAIHQAAGMELDRECMTLGGCKTGDAKITKGYKLPANHIIHTVGPVWEGGNSGERELLASCYRRSLEVALENGCESVAFPLISAGIFGYPRAEAIRVAVDAISGFLAEQEITVYLVVFDKESFEIGSGLFADIARFIDDNYAEQHSDARYRRPEFPMACSAPMMPKQKVAGEMQEARTRSAAKLSAPHSEDAAADVDMLLSCAAPANSLEEALGQLDESFSQMLLRIIDERGMKDSECYKKANIDRKLFSKIRSDIHYRPSKPTVLAFAIALELSLPETSDMLKKAGYALSRSSKSDIIVEYFIQHGNYNIFEINEALFAFDQSLLGA